MPLNDQFMYDLTNADKGCLSQFLQWVRDDHTIALVIRDERRIDTYYRGGLLFRISQADVPGAIRYSAWHDPNYHVAAPLPNPFPIGGQEAVGHLLSELNSIKTGMDTHFANKFRMEREFQQLTLRENNFSAISPVTDYFVVSIECADVLQGARFDMFCCRWAAANRARTGKLIPGAVEMKYGNGAINGPAGIVAHYHDARNLFLDTAAWHGMVQDMQENLRQLDTLGLVRYNHSTTGNQLVIAQDKPQLIFLIASYNMRSAVLRNALDALVNLRQTYEHRGDESKFSLRFFSAPFAGYGMYNSCMMTLENFREEVVRRHALGFNGE